MADRAVHGKTPIQPESWLEIFNREADARDETLADRAQPMMWQLERFPKPCPGQLRRPIEYGFDAPRPPPKHHSCFEGSVARTSDAPRRFPLASSHDTGIMKGQSGRQEHLGISRLAVPPQPNFNNIRNGSINQKRTLHAEQTGKTVDHETPVTLNATPGPTIRFFVGCHVLSSAHASFLIKCDWSDPLLTSATTR